MPERSRDPRKHVRRHVAGAPQGRGGKGQALTVPPDADEPHAALLHDVLLLRRGARRQPDMATAERRMSGKRQLPLRREDAHPIVGFRIRRRQQERGFAEIGPVGDGRHVLVRQAIRADHDGERIALERLPP